MGQPDLTRPDPQSDWPEPVFNPLKMTNDMIDPQPDWPDSTRTDPPVLPSLKLYVIGFFFLFFWAEPRQVCLSVWLNFVSIRWMSDSRSCKFESLGQQEIVVIKLALNANLRFWMHVFI